MSENKKNATHAEIAEVLRKYDSFALMSHVRPDGDAIGSQLALGMSLEALGKRVVYLNEDGLADNLAFLPGSERIQRPSGPVDVEVAVALDTATKPRLGDGVLAAVSESAKIWLNIDHHVSNPRYGDLNLIVGTSPATGEILYELMVDQEMPMPPGSRDAIYVAISTDTGSFQYDSTTARTYEIAADLVRRGVQVGKINELTWDDYPYRRIELLRALLNTLELECGGRVAHWELTIEMRRRIGALPEDSEGLINHIRAIRGVVVAMFYEELENGKVRVSMRSKDRRVDVCQVATTFGGGGHVLAAGIRMPGPLPEAKKKVLAEIEKRLESAGLSA